MTNELQKRIDHIAEFAADVAHELKNPITSVRSASETISKVRKLFFYEKKAAKNKLKLA